MQVAEGGDRRGERETIGNRATCANEAEGGRGGGTFQGRGRKTTNFEGKTPERKNHLTWIKKKERLKLRLAGEPKTLKKSRKGGEVKEGKAPRRNRKSYQRNYQPPHGTKGKPKNNVTSLTKPKREKKKKKKKLFSI